MTLSPVSEFFGYVLGTKHEIRWCFAVADVSQSYAACAWQTRWPQN